MFTGIVEEVGRIERIESRSMVRRVVVRATTVLAGTKIGDSISVDGACLTVVALGAVTFSVDVQQETLRRTVTGQYRPGTRVNLERALTPSSRMGGHYVQGHVDGLGTVVSWRQERGDWVLRVRMPAELRKYVVEKGFVAVNGVSLTAASCRGSVSFHVIPHTRTATALQDRGPGDPVNIEVDVMAKYAESLLQ